MSEKHDNFVRLAESRVNKALDAMRVIGNLTNRSYYEFDADEAKEIIQALQAGLNELKIQFAKTDSDAPRGFTLSQKKSNRS